MGIYRRRNQWWISYAVDGGRKDEPAGRSKLIAARLLELREAQVRLGVLDEADAEPSPGDRHEPRDADPIGRLELIETLVRLTEYALEARAERRSLRVAVEALGAKLDRLELRPQYADAAFPNGESAGKSEPRYLSVKEAAVYLGVTPASLYHRISMGTVPYRKVKGRLILDRLGLDRWIAKAPGVSVQEALRNW